MDRQQIGVKLTVDALGLPFKIDGFADRLILQKAVYLAQAAGVNLGYYYHWYLHGPYCASLTRDEYAVAWELAQDVDDSQDWSLDQDSQNRLGKMKSLLTNTDREQLRKWLELLASVHFLVDRKAVPDGNYAEITNTLRRFGKDFGQEQVEDAMKELSSYGLVGG